MGSRFITGLALALCLSLGACTSNPSTAPGDAKTNGADRGEKMDKTTGRTFTNPILRGMNPDPSIIRVGDDFYLTTSTFEYFPGLPVYHSRDLVNWELIGHALDRDDNCPLLGAGSATGGNYAPTLRYDEKNKRFYIACTNYGGQGSQGAFYVWADNPAGPWSDPVWVRNWYVDPSISFDDGVMYWLSPNNKDGFMLGIWDPVEEDFVQPLEKIADGTGSSAPEGPHLYKINDWYYLMSAEGGTGLEHMEVIQRSRSPWGPYEKSPDNPVLSHRKSRRLPFQAIGHADLVQLKDGTWWAVCLGYRPKGGNYHNLGRETFLAPITWSAEGWPKVGSKGIVETEFKAPDLPEHPWPAEAARDNFDSPTLRLAWNFIRNPDPGYWSLSERPGFLRLKGSAVNFTQKDSPAFVGRRQEDFVMQASVRLDFTPVADNEEAGLVVRADDSNHYDLMVTLVEGKRTVTFRTVIQGNAETWKNVEIPGGAVTLKVSSTELEYQFWLQMDQTSQAELLGKASMKDLATERVGGFTGTYIGMYASGNGTPTANPADFDWFEMAPDLPGAGK